jgi:class 3 adenylate cyclase
LKRSEFLAKSRIENEANNVQDILAILVPKFVKDRLTHGDTAMQEAQDDVGILFCDICDFDKVINSEGTKIVEILDEIFRNFDHLCLKHGIQKIEVFLLFLIFLKI